jgi:hypothetical protein
MFATVCKMARTIYGTSKTKKPKPTIPPEMDINVYLTRLINTIVSIKDKTSKDAALARMENMETDLQTILNKEGK